MSSRRSIAKDQRLGTVKGQQLELLATRLPLELRKRRLELIAVGVELTDQLARQERQKLRVCLSVRAEKKAKGSLRYTNEKARQEAVQHALDQNATYQRRARRIKALRVKQQKLEAEIEFLKRMHTGVVAVLRAKEEV